MNSMQSLSSRYSVGEQGIAMMNLLFRVDIFRFFEVTISGMVMGLTIFFFMVGVERIFTHSNSHFFPSLVALIIALIIWLQAWVTDFIIFIRNQESSTGCLVERFSWGHPWLVNMVFAYLLIGLVMALPGDLDTLYVKDICQVQEEECEISKEPKRKKAIKRK